MGLITKGQKLRNIVDCTRGGLNEFLAKLRPKLDSVADAITKITPGCRLSKVDLTDGFFHIAVNATDSDLLGVMEPATGLYYRYRF